MGQPQARALEDPLAMHGPVDLRPADLEEGRQVGVIKSFSKDKRYGFILCEALALTHGGDVFLSDQEIAAFKVGEGVSFKIAYNKHNRPQARDLEVAELPSGYGAFAGFDVETGSFSAATSGPGAGGYEQWT